MHRLIISSLALGSALCALAASPTMTPVDGYPRFALGADLSWTPYIEQNHLHTYYKGNVVASDQVTDIPQMVYDHGIDAVRLRVWVDPFTDKAMSGFSFKAYGYSYDVMSTYGTCSVQEMVALAKRFAAQGHRLLVTFQMSDQWADPGRQFIPKAWEDCTSVDELSARAVEHVQQVLQLLHDANVNVAWVQIGNETNNGMLEWKVPAQNGAEVTTVPFGCQVAQTSANVPAQTTRNFVRVFNDCAVAAKKIYPGAKTIMHLTKTAEWSTLNWSLNLLVKAGLSAAYCDYIGLSLYPGIDDGQENYTAKWKTYADLGLRTISNIYSTYGFRTMLCEIGMNNEYSLSANLSGVSDAGKQAAYIAQCNADVRAFTQYLIDNLAREGSTCDGLFYWEPETDYMKNYTKGACVSATPGASWPRDKVTPNDWWKVVAEHSTFPAGGLTEYVISDDDTPDFVPDPSLELYLYYYTDTDNFVPLATSDGLLYTLSGFPAQQWFNFKVVTRDFSISLGNAEIGLGQVGTLNNGNDWNAWTSTVTSASDHWWYRQDTHQMTITAADSCPWADIAAIPGVSPDDSGAPVLYNLQGIRVDSPSPGVYIRRCGRSVSKVLIR